MPKVLSRWSKEKTRVRGEESLSSGTRGYREVGPDTKTGARETMPVPECSPHSTLSSNHSEGRRPNLER